MYADLNEHKIYDWKKRLTDRGFGGGIMYGGTSESLEQRIGERQPRTGTHGT